MLSSDMHAAMPDSPFLVVVGEVFFFLVVVGDGVGYSATSKAERRGEDAAMDDGRGGVYAAFCPFVFELFALGAVGAPFNTPLLFVVSGWIGVLVFLRLEPCLGP